MASIEEILDKYSVAELKSVAKENNLPISGSKPALISMLASSVSAKKILNCISNKQLQTILGKYSLPKSGTKDEMISRLLSSKKAPKQKTVSTAKGPVREAPTVEVNETAYKKGHDFEEKFATYCRRHWKPTFVRTKQARNGLSVKRPYDVDVHICFKGSGLFASRSDIWIECKNRKSTIKRADISKLIDSARDVYHAYKSNREDIYFDRLGFVSTSEFDSDAIAYANQYDVICLYYNGKSFTQKNDVSWETEPAWLKQIK